MSPRKVPKEVLRERRKLWSLKRRLRVHNHHLSPYGFIAMEFRDPNGFHNYTRMSSPTFTKLLMKLRPIFGDLSIIHREAIPISTRLLLTLRYLATGSTFTQLSDDFRVSINAVLCVIPITLRAMYNALKEDYLKMPQTTEDWKKVALKINEKWKFPMCLGSIGGIHIAVRSNEEVTTRNYKGYHSVVFLALADANYNFIYVDVGRNADTTDDVAFNDAIFRSYIRNKRFPRDEKLPDFDKKLPYVFVADNSFSLSPRLMRPYDDSRKKADAIFNYRLFRIRQLVQNAFGILADKFKIFQREFFLPYDKVELVTLTSCALHNFIRIEEGFPKLADKENTDQCKITAAAWRERVLINGFQKYPGNCTDPNGINIRNMFTQYFNTAGTVPWQNKTVKKYKF